MIKDLNMLKDINGNSNLTDSKNKPLISLDKLYNDFNDATFFDIKKECILGYAKFNPIVRHDNSYSKTLDKNTWYPILKINKNSSIDLQNFKNMHIGFFSHIVAVDKYTKLFDLISNKNPKVKKYWAKKIKDEKDFELLVSKIKKEHNEKEDLKAFIVDRIGLMPKKTYLLSNLISGKIISDEKKINFLKKIDNKNINDVSNDVEYRIKLFELLNTLKSLEVLESNAYYEKDVIKHFISENYSCGKRKNITETINILKQVKTILDNRSKLNIFFSEKINKIKLLFSL